MGGAIRGGSKLSEEEGSNQRWRDALRGGGQRSEAEGSNQKWREAISLTEVERGKQRRRVAIRGGAVKGGRERSEVEGSDQR